MMARKGTGSSLDEEAIHRQKCQSEPASCRLCLPRALPMALQLPGPGRGAVHFRLRPAVPRSLVFQVQIQ